ncbi:MAG: hypothetical protein U5R14_06670 [Gemmatimonadota bacterium]|nr:hypothetical protein [Gemmatimonadota bacterium]
MKGSSDYRGHPCGACRSVGTGRAAILLALLGTVACEPVPEVARDPDPLLQTSELRYRIERHDIGYSTQVVYTFRNDTGADVHLENCDGDIRPLLQVRREGRWVDAWRPLMRECASEPVVIERGARLTDTLEVVGAPPESNVSPSFVFEDVEGVYRLYWFQSRLVPEGESGGDASDPGIPWRTSNPFALAFP